MAEIPLIFAIGLLGSAHCVGMCGGFVLALSQGGGGSSWYRLWLYFGGKTLTYTLFGVVAGAGGQVLLGMAAGVQTGISLALGLLLVLVGLGLLGLRIRMPGWTGVGEWLPLSRGLAGLLRQNTPWAYLGLGLLNGLLPCGLVYALLAKASVAGSAWAGGVTMAVFGLATIPALTLLGVGGHRLRPAWRYRLHQASGVLVILLGLLTLLRATPALDHIFHLMGHAH